MKLGAHVSAAGGLSKAIDRAHGIGAEAMQIFASSPRGWAFKPPTEEEIETFRKKSEASGTFPTFLHGIYLINMGGPPELIQKSMDSLSRHMDIAGRIGATGVIFHGGSHKGVGFDNVLDQVAGALEEVLSRSPDQVSLIMENSAGMGNHIGASFEEMGRLMDVLDSPQLKVCLDTQHCFAAGYNLVDPDGIDLVLEDFDRHIGLSKLVAVHANDSKTEFGSGVDRHENIGEGHMGLDGFEVILSHPAFQKVPFLLEVPGFDNKGPDKENLDRLKTIRKRLGIPN